MFFLSCQIFVCVFCFLFFGLLNGAVIVKDGKIVARGHNLKETKFDTTNHAEIMAIQRASKKLRSWRLLDCEMYVTLEPCSMCAGALINSRIKKVYIGADDAKTGAVGSVFNLLEDYTFNHIVQFERGILKEPLRFKNHLYLSLLDGLFNVQTIK